MAGTDHYTLVSCARRNAGGNRMTGRVRDLPDGPPPKLQIAVSNCRTVNVVRGEPGYAFVFQSFPL